MLALERLPGVWRRAHKHADPATLYEIREAATLPAGDVFDVRVCEYAPELRLLRLKEREEIPTSGGRCRWVWSTSSRVPGDTIQAEFCDDPRCEALRTLNLPHRPPFRGMAPWAAQLSRGARYASATYGSREERLRARAALVALQLTAEHGGLPAFVIVRELGLVPRHIAHLKAGNWLRVRGVQPGYVRGSHPELELLHVLGDDVEAFREHLQSLPTSEPRLFFAPSVANPRRLRRFLSVLPSAVVFQRVRALAV